MKRILLVPFIVCAFFACQQKSISNSSDNQEALIQYLNQKIEETDKLIEQYPDSAQLKLTRDFIVQRRKELKR
jgi:hypothetical protein